MPNKSSVHLYRYKQHHLLNANVPKRVAFWVITAFILIVAVTLIDTQFHTAVPAGISTVFQRVTPGQLIWDSLLTLARLTIAYFIGLIATSLILLLISIHHRVENAILPILDILQSIPVLAFFPLIIIAFADLQMPELSAQIVLVMAMTWSVMFGAIGGLHQIPEDIMEAAQIYGAKGWRKFSKIVLPAILPNLITGSMLSFGAGWNVIIISEYINYGKVSIRLLGLGSLLSSSAGNDTGIFIVSLLMLVLIITLINRLVWHRLIEYSEKFKFE